MFPQGKRIKDDSRGNLKTGVAVIAHKMQVPVVPVSICGKYKFRSKITVHMGNQFILTSSMVKNLMMKQQLN